MIQHESPSPYPFRGSIMVNAKVCGGELPTSTAPDSGPHSEHVTDTLSDESRAASCATRARVSSSTYSCHGMDPVGNGCANDSSLSLHGRSSRPAVQWLPLDRWLTTVRLCETLASLVFPDRDHWICKDAGHLPLMRDPSIDDRNASYMYSSPAPVCGVSRRLLHIGVRN